jgi:hypothetical protein
MSNDWIDADLVGIAGDVVIEDVSGEQVNALAESFEKTLDDQRYGLNRPERIRKTRETKDCTTTEELNALDAEIWKAAGGKA